MSQKKEEKLGKRETLIVPSSEPVARSCTPLREAEQVLTNDVCPLSFFTLWPTAQSHTAPVLSVEAVNMRLRERGREGGMEIGREGDREGGR